MFALHQTLIKLKCFFEIRNVILINYRIIVSKHKGEEAIHMEVLAFLP